MTTVAGSSIIAMLFCGLQNIAVVAATLWLVVGPAERQVLQAKISSGLAKMKFLIS